jgi:hypothetical protein
MNSLVLSSPQTESRVFIVDVFRWMTGGLAVTGAVAWFLSARPEAIAQIAGNPVVFWGLCIAELAAVFVLSGRTESLSPATATALFLGYAAINGLTLSVIFLVYTQSSIANAFFVTAGTFAAMSVYGSITKTDLTSIGNLAFMALIGLIIASVVNIFLRSSGLDWATAYAGVLIFTALTAYDAQRIKAMHAAGEDETNEAISGALALYLDFVNLFLSLLRIMGRRRED